MKKSLWSLGLLHAMKNPKKKVMEDDKVVVIRDKYPKAQFHYLVLPKEDIASIWYVTKKHEELLSHMARVAEDLTKQHKESEFFIGYHATPSMHRLHLHVISTDFNSPCLKTKQHWNSFTTPYLLRSKDVCQQLRKQGRLKKMNLEVATQYLSTPLKCHKCSERPKSMPALKKHLLTHSLNAN